MAVKIKVIQPKRSLKDNLNLLLRYRELLYVWTSREIRARYRQSALGFGWALITPIVQMVVISVIFGGFLRVPSSSTDIPYPVFAYVALLPWQFFAGGINGAVPSVRNNMQLVTKIYFPREILPFSAVLSRLVDFLIGALVFVGLVIYFQMPIYGTWLFVPILILIQIVLAMGFGILGAAVSVFLRDISFAVPLALQLWMYATPIIYDVSEVPEQLLPIYSLNPMVGIITSYRLVILEGQLPGWHELAYPVTFAMIVFAIAYVYFKRLEMAISDII